ncbi:putative bifunctional diguanylate cyclase/phosphodiesterase [Prosthecodimorpha staleyi]|uniref:Bifunctional diguanylate cyclase/phosphodiesterase n=1 Tax=Prosthecodimorpha staleyi TaxID=2840188 RepID=A0A947GGX7_9HYPH|nr:bifunctional diguanylate cyclase/phosphodiesterase [Prosthecodimorpha staleyi]MBT9293000.1 bifunctional diguanylate cyclase/phosphodiesterase [Prosthecodimorpha staleyi]
MWNSDRLRYGLFAIVPVMGIASITLPAVVWNTNAALERSVRHDIAWTAEHGRRELTTFSHHVMTYSLNPSAEAADGIRLYHDILLARLNTWASGSFRKFIDERNSRQETLATISTGLNEIGRHIATIEMKSAQEAVLGMTSKVQGAVDILVSEAQTASANQITRNHEQLRLLQSIQQLLIAGLLISGFMLIAILLLQNRLLRRANAAEKETAEQYEYIAAHDTLTGLPNRAAFRTAFASALTNRQPDALKSGGNGLAVCIVDLDGFKPINDTLGHLIGDKLLVATADRLRKWVVQRPGSVASRFGGDEFVILLANVGGAEAAMQAADAIHGLLRAPHEINGQVMFVDASIGVSVSNGGSGAVDLLLQADLALNRSKSAGKGTVMLYEPGMEDEIVRRRALEIELGQAVANKEFEPFYQPIIDLPTGSVVGIEALVRWRHPRRGLVSPSEFIAVAESSGHIVEIGQIVLEKACLDASALAKPIQVSVNLSMVQLMRVDVPAMVADILARTALAPERLKLEITESVMMCDEARSRDLISRLRELGIWISLDDFGTGYSSLSYLRGFGFDEIKIDRSFVSALDQDPESLAIVQTIIALGRRLGLRVVAEGIETEFQANMIMACGCTRGQGYLFSEPVPFPALKALIEPSMVEAARVA